jgi:spoIIIJ-associated protein
MAEDLEFRAPNVQTALEKACRELKVKPGELRHAVVSNGSRGFFGLVGARQAVIRVQPPEAAPEGAAAGVGTRCLREQKRSGRLGAVPASAEPPTEAAVKAGQSVLRRILDAISPEAHLEVQPMDDGVKFCVTGGESGILIGKQGQTLEAMQAIVERAVNRGNDQRVFVLVDVEGYLEAKRAGLIHDAERLALRVRQQGHALSLGYLNSQERRTVHLALRGHAGLRTQSVGEGPLRKLLILPGAHQDNPA